MKNGVIFHLTLLYVHFLSAIDYNESINLNPLPIMYQNKVTTCIEYILDFDKYFCNDIKQRLISASEVTTPYDLVRPQSKSWFMKWPDVFYGHGGYYDEEIQGEPDWAPEIYFMDNPVPEFIKNRAPVTKSHAEVWLKVDATEIYDAAVVSKIHQKGAMLYIYTIILKTKKEKLLATIHLKKKIITFDYDVWNAYYNKTDKHRKGKQEFLLYRIGAYKRALQAIPVYEKPWQGERADRYIPASTKFFSARKNYCDISYNAEGDRQLYEYVTFQNKPGWILLNSKNAKSVDRYRGYIYVGSVLVYSLPEPEKSYSKCIFYNPDLPNGYADLQKYPRFTITASRLNVREKPTTKSKALFLAPRGTIAFQLEDTGVKGNFEGRNNTWRKVRLLNGVVGYVFGGYLTKAR